MSWKASRRTTEKRRNGNPALQGAYDKGQRARRRGDPWTSCPYRDDGPAKGWRRAFRTSWEKGWTDAG